MILQQRGWGLRIGHELAASLQGDGHTLAAITLKPQTDAFTRSQSGVSYQEIYSHDAVMDTPESIAPEVGDQLQTICDGLDIDSVWPLVQSMRSHVKDYEESYYYSFRQSIDDEALIQLTKAEYRFCTSILDSFRPDLIITPNFVGLPHLMLELLGRRRGIPMLGVTDSKVNGIILCVHDHEDSTGRFFNLLQDASLGTPSQEAIQRIEGMRDRLRMGRDRPISIPSSPSAKELPYALKEAAKRSFHRAGSKTALDNRSMKTIVRDFRAHRAYRRHALGRTYESLPDGPYAYFPLQFQPEATIDVVSPRFNNQLETARQVAMSMPGPMRLVVKEHPDMVGRRKPSFHDKLARTPNVVLVSPTISSARILEGTACVVGVSGTTMMDAALLGVPAVQLGPLGTTAALPNVQVHDDLLTIARPIKQAWAAGRLGGREYDLALGRFVQAALDVGLQVDYFGLWEHGTETDFDPIYAWYRHEIAHALSARAAQEYPGDLPLRSK